MLLLGDSIAPELRPRRVRRPRPPKKRVYDRPLRLHKVIHLDA